MPDNSIEPYITKNNGTVRLDSIPVFNYPVFCERVLELLGKEENHCVSYFAFPDQAGLWFIIAIADDNSGEIALLSHRLPASGAQQLESLTPAVNALHIFEREIYENYAVVFSGHPWLKPVRYAHNRADKHQIINNYPFYQIDSHELHEVGVGPVHAGIIEPGHFRFICNGENVLHLEIQLGWQHRGIEDLMLRKRNLLQRTILSESIAGDTAVGHSLAFAGLMESLSGTSVSHQLQLERALALELERIAIHVADIGALCTDVAFGLGAGIFGILRTGIINFTQSWCGNRLGKGMIRAGGTNFPFNNDLKEKLLQVLASFESQFVELAHHTYKLPSVENRFDDIGTVSREQMLRIGAVGMTARMANLKRDIRWSHPFAAFGEYPIEPIVLPKGDVFSRFLLRRKEIKKSIAWIRNILDTVDFGEPVNTPVADLKLQPESFAISLTEGWRGEISHCAVTDADGNLRFYKIKDPSMHNWKALELSLRNLEISDFPINNKSYNLSYCGFDL